MVKRTSIVAWLVGSVIACGGESEEPKTAASAPETSANHSTPAQNKLGRFVSADGRYAILLDRSGANAKLQVEGERDIFELTEREARGRSGHLEGYEYVDPNNKVRLLIGTSGSITFFVNGDPAMMGFDKATAPLGAATVAGPPKKEVPAYQAASDALAARSVVTKLPEFKAADSTDLAKVAAAFAKADASSFARYVKIEGGWEPSLQVAPSDVSGPGFGRSRWATDETEAAKHKKLAAYGATLAGYSEQQSQGNHIVAESASQKLQSNTPGLIWSVDGYRVVFVSFDGGRYEVDLPQSGNKGTEPLEATIGAESSWPKPVQNAFLDYTEIGRLAKIDAPGAKETLAALEKIDNDWNQCAQTAWKPANAKIEINKFRPEDAKALSVKTQSSCRKYLDSFESTLVGFLDKRKAERQAIFDKAKARAAALGVK